MDGPALRVALVGLLVAMLVCQFFYFGANAPDSPARSLSGTVLDRSYDTFVGREGVVEGAVVSTEPVVLGIDRDDTNVRLTLRGLDERVSTGDHLRVYGVVEPDHEFRVLGAVVVPRWGLYYTYGISALAGLWVLTRLLRHWQFDAGRLAVGRREGTPSSEGER